MNQLFAVALGGSCGAVLRFLMSSGIYHWLGRGFPYGTLAVNVIGSFLLGLLTEALILNRIPLTLEYRAAILVGFIGAFTTFSTFSLETVYLLEQGHTAKAVCNVSVSIIACLLAVWIGLQCGKLLSGGVIQWTDGIFPYSLIMVNTLGAFLIGLIAAVLLQKAPIGIEHQLALVVITVGSYLTLSGLYVLLYLLEHGYSFASHTTAMLIGFAGNTFACLLVMWLGLLAAKQI
ncbi:MAG: fluoride efflux transporter CrcB [Methylovulum sp.]|nr:fluoride efflux transporter CrcB [Methylovulum sp.]